MFRKIVDDTDPAVDVIFTAHTHMKYSYTDPAHNGRPVIQTGSYAANIGQVVLDYDKATGTVTYRKSGNVAVDTSKSDDELAAAGDDTVRNVKSIVDAAVAKGQEEGDKPVAPSPPTSPPPSRTARATTAPPNPRWATSSPTRCSTHCRPRTAAAPKSAW